MAFTWNLLFKPHLNSLLCKATQNPDTGSTFPFSLQSVETLCIFTARQTWSHPLGAVCENTKRRRVLLSKPGLSHRGPKPQHEAWDRQPKHSAAAYIGLTSGHKPKLTEWLIDAARKRLCTLLLHLYRQPNPSHFPLLSLWQHWLSSN